MSGLKAYSRLESRRDCRSRFSFALRRASYPWFAHARARARVGPPRLTPKQIRQIGAAFRLSFIASCPGNYSCNYLFQIAAAHFRCHTLLATSRTEILLPITPNHCSHSALTSSPHFKIGPRGKARAWARAPLLSLTNINLLDTFASQPASQPSFHFRKKLTN